MLPTRLNGKWGWVIPVSVKHVRNPFHIPDPSLLSVLNTDQPNVHRAVVHAADLVLGTTVKGTAADGGIQPSQPTRPGPGSAGPMPGAAQAPGPGPGVPVTVGGHLRRDAAGGSGSRGARHARPGRWAPEPALADSDPGRVTPVASESESSCRDPSRKARAVTGVRVGKLVP